jgi:hypothetical protein
MKNGSIYLDQCLGTLPRLLGLFDSDRHSPTRGMGDRYRWAWKLIDFGNGTYQGAAHGLARLLVHRLLPESMAENAVLRRIEETVQAAAKLRDRNGSLSEAFPHESSFCVTALVAYDLLQATELLLSHISRQTRERYLETVAPMIGFLHRCDETHGFISNHLAVAAAALYRWTALTGEPGEERGRRIVARILAEQSDEGWFVEYEGADPGYQSLCTYYLADLHRMRPDLALLEPLRQSVRFLWRFAHPDGSFGGCYGSRNTRFFCPAGLEALGPEIPEAASLAAFMGRSIGAQTTVTLSSMDDSNLVPMFNAYAWAAALRSEAPEIREPPLLPALSTEPERVHFPEAGLLVERSRTHYTVVSLHKGGACCHFPRGSRAVIDAGAVAKSESGVLVSTQDYDPENPVDLSKDSVTVKAGFRAMKQRLPTPLNFIVLRLLSVTLMRCSNFNSCVKRALVQLLITGKSRVVALNRRTIRFAPEFRIEDAWEGGAEGWERISGGGGFSSIHMASQGYWQRQDDEG